MKVAKAAMETSVASTRKSIGTAIVKWSASTRRTNTRKSVNASDRIAMQTAITGIDEPVRIFVCGAVFKA